MMKKMINSAIDFLDGASGCGCRLCRIATPYFRWQWRACINLWIAVYLAWLGVIPKKNAWVFLATLVTCALLAALWLRASNRRRLPQPGIREGD